MDFGKLADLSGVDFTFPEDPAFSRAFLDALPERRQPAHIFLGCTGWAMPQWVGKWYPAGAKSKDFLYHYAKQFNTIELNTTHYRIPSLDMVRQWCDSVPPDFRFCPKVPQTISHDRQLALGTPAVRAFAESVAEMGDRLGCCFLQLPPYFGPDRLRLLEAFLADWPAQLPMAVEVRHEDWFAQPRHIEALADLLAAYETAAVITDVAGRRDVLHLFVTAPRTLIRFVGNDLHPTDYRRADDWVARILQWTAGARLPEVYFFSHQPDNILSPELALYLWQQLTAGANFETRPPKPVPADGESGQMSLF